ncbi:MAG: pentapeptide repeat-containing protein [Acidimicrobiales bacterium]|nr:pentapeptide repeat-containing protein [Acidimicrobiales bacterium]
MATRILTIAIVITVISGACGSDNEPTAPTTTAVPTTAVPTTAAVSTNAPSVTVADILTEAGCTTQESSWDCFGADLSNTDLSDSDLAGSIFLGADLRGATLRNSNLSGIKGMGTNFSGADLTGADLGGAEVSGANFTDAQLTDADLTGIHMDLVVAAGADLAGSDLSGTFLPGVDFSGADLTNVNLTFTHLSGADFTGADLRYADLRGAHLGETDYTVGVFANSNWPGPAHAGPAVFTNALLGAAKFCFEHLIGFPSVLPDGSETSAHDLDRLTDCGLLAEVRFIESPPAEAGQAMTDLELALQLVSGESNELRIALIEALRLANSLDATEYPDCNPVHAADRSLFGIPTGADMVEVIAQVSERCGPPDPFIARYDSWDSTPDRDQWGSMCAADDVSTYRTWQVGDRFLTVNFYRDDDGSQFTLGTGWMFGWTGGDLPGGIEVGMTKEEVTDILGLDPDGFVHEDLSDYLIDTPDFSYFWGEGVGWGMTASTHGQPLNTSVLYFDEGLLSGFDSTDFNLCQ